MKLLQICYPTFISEKISSLAISVTKLPWQIRFFIENNFLFLIAAQLQLMVFKQVTSWVDILSDVLAIILFAATILVPIFSFVHIRKLHNQDKLEKSEIKEIYGELYEANLHIHPNMKRLAYNALFMLRRAITSFCMLHLKTIPSLQIGIQLFMCVFWTGYTLAEQPLEDPLLNKVESINNFFYWFTLLDCYNLTQQNDNFQS